MGKWEEAATDGYLPGILLRATFNGVLRKTLTREMVGARVVILNKTYKPGTGTNNLSGAGIKRPTEWPCSSRSSCRTPRLLESDVVGMKAVAGSV